MESGQLANSALSGYCSRNDSVLISITALIVMTDTGTRSHNSPAIVDESLEIHMTLLNIGSEICKKAGRRLWNRKAEEKQSPGVATL